MFPGLLTQKTVEAQVGLVRSVCFGTRYLKSVL